MKAFTHLFITFAVVMFLCLTAHAESKERRAAVAPAGAEAPNELLRALAEEDALEADVADLEETWRVLQEQSDDR